MKNIISLLLILICFTSYSQSNKTDPNFIETRDTVSIHGPISLTRHMLQDKNGNMWFATWQGIMKYDGKVFTNYTLKENLIHFHVYSVMEDRGGNLWFGTIGGGAYKYDGKTFTLFTRNDGLVNDEVGYIMEDKTGNIWFGTEGGVSRLDAAAIGRTSAKIAEKAYRLNMEPTYKNGFATYTTANGLTGDRVNAIIQDKGGKIWIGTRTGVSCYDGKSFTNVTKKGIPFSNVRSIKEDKTGKIWIGGQDGLYCYDPTVAGEKAFTRLMPDFICYILEDKKGNIWFSTIERLYKYDGKDFINIIGKPSGIALQIFEDVSPICEIAEDKNGNIWFNTKKGLCRYDGKTFTYFRK